MSESQPAKELTGLEKEMAALLAQTADINSGAKQFKSEATKVRRKSRDLELQISSMTAPDKFGAAAGRRSRRQSRDYSEDALKIAFDVIDTNKTGSIPEEKLLEASAIRLIRSAYTFSLSNSSAWPCALLAIETILP